MKQETHASLIKAARRIFARHGYEGASVRAITAAAKANLGAVTYHFSSKRKLYEQVLESSANPLADRVEAAAHAAGSARERVGNVVRIYFDYLASNPELGQLLMQELVLARTPPTAVAVPIRRIHTALMQLVQDGQRSGEFRDGDAALMAISIISQPVHMNLIRHALKAFTGIDMGDVATRERLIQHATDFACAGLSAQQGNSQ